MADIEDSGFGIESISLVDNSIATLSSTPTVINILSSIHPVFTSDGKDNKLVEKSSLSEVLSEYGSDFADINKYGQQNLNAEQVLQNGGTVYLCRLLPENAKTAHVAIKVGVKKVNSIPLYKRDAYGDFLLDDDGNKIPVTVKKVTTTDESGTTEVDEPAYTSGIQIKVFTDSADDTDWTKYPTAKKLSKKFKTLPTTEDEDGYKIFPLEFVYYYANGKCGNDYGIRIINDFDRDEKVDDGRRYQMFLVKKTTSGFETLSIGDGISYSYNPEATVSKTVTTLEGLQRAYQNYNGTEEKQIQIDYYQTNYTSLKSTIESMLSEDLVVSEGVDTNSLRVPTSMEEFDIFNGYAKDGYSFDNVLVDENSANLSNPVYFQGGSDGDFDTLTGDELEAAKESLLKKFFSADIDTANLRDVLRCDGAIVYDAGYSLTTKMDMLNLINYRRDICTVFDCGETDDILEAVNIASQIREKVSASGSENYAIVPHFGTTTNRSVNVRVSGTYEFAGGITSLYRKSPFTIYAGKPNDNGAVKNMLFDWVVEETKPRGYYEKLAKNARLYYAIDLGKACSSYASGDTTGRHIYFFSNANLYSEKLSKLAEFRNGVLVNDIRRILKLVLCKYTFDSEGADAAMSKAREELVKQFNNRYPANVSIALSLFQTERDKLLNQATCQVTVTFPDVFETWNCTIIAARNGTTEA